MQAADQSTSLTDTLYAEHRVIERVLACLSVLATRARNDGSFDRNGAARILEFIVEFADRIHHMKEEDRLFPALEAAGLPRDAGPTSVMRHEHDVGRKFVHALAADLDEAASSGGVARQRFIAHAFDFVDLLREHIAKEDQVLFPMAERMLPPPTQRALIDGFARDHAALPEGRGRDYFHALADELCARFDVTEVVREPASFGGCGGASAPRTHPQVACDTEPSAACCGGSE